MIELRGHINLFRLYELAYRSVTLRDIVSVLSVTDFSDCLSNLSGSRDARVPLPQGVRYLFINNPEGKPPSWLLDCLLKKLSLEEELSRDKIYPKEQRYYLIVDFREKKAYWGVLLRSIRRDRFIYRSPEKRAFVQFSALSPKMALFLVNLSSQPFSLEASGTFLDPFCGSGGNLIEAALLGFYAVGIEVYYRPIRGARRNAIQYNLYGNIDFILADAAFPPLREKSFNAIAFDPPYGRLAPVKSEKAHELLLNFLRQVRFILKEEGKCVFLYPRDFIREKLIEMGFKEKCCIFEHSRLTRCVWCLGDEC